MPYEAGRLALAGPLPYPDPRRVRDDDHYLGRIVRVKDTQLQHVMDSTAMLRGLP
jgi:hypothetical protein